MANELWRIGLGVIIALVLYWRMWHRRTPSAKKGYLLISLIGFLMCFVIFADSSLPKPLLPLVIAPTITGAVLAVLFMHKYYKSLNPKE